MSLLLGETPLRAFASSLRKKPVLSDASYANDAAFVFPLDLKAARKEAEAIRELVSELIPLLRSPHLENKRQEVILRQEESGPLSVENMRSSIRDTALWRKKRGAFSPEYVHASYNEDELVTYENRFICCLIDHLTQSLAELARSSVPLEKSLRERYGGAGNSYGPYGLYADLIHSEETPLSAQEEEGELSSFLADIAHLQGRVRQLKATPFYREVSPHPFQGEPYPTNILLHDEHYNAAFRYYRAHYLVVEENANLDLLYRNYALMRILAYAFQKQEAKPLVSLTKGLLHFETITLTRRNFLYTFQEEGNDLLISVSRRNLPVPSFRHRLHFAYAHTAEDSLAPVLPSEEEIAVSAFTETAEEEGVLCLSLFESGEELLKTLLASFRMSIPSLSSERCPICGDNRVHVENGVSYCPQCHSSFATAAIGNSERLWLGILGRRS